ncbi:branched-chain-amino-acid transaminase [Candidatus Bathyarchaeota archaeon]|nr:branched-chain-amino-acid transaminase [Candidatus Bathyarchaeota archaeon]
MSSENLIYIDGKYYPKSEAKISVYDHGFLYGDGVFEGIRVYNSHVFKLEEHLNRLYDSAKSIALSIPLGKLEFREAILETIRKNSLRDAYLRVVVTRGYGDLGLNPVKCAKASVVIIADYIAPLYEGISAKAIVAATRRNNPDSLDPQIKSLNYLNNILAKMEANRAGVDEAIMLNQQGLVCEGTSDNLFVVKNGILITPPLSDGALGGITRSAVLELAAQLKIPVEEKSITVHEIMASDEAFLTGTAAEIGALVEVNGQKIGDGKPGPMWKILSAAFKGVRESGTPVNE